MITLITGAPGAGKSAALVSLLLELSKDRAIYVNGIPDLKIDHLPLDNPSSWPDTVPDGSVIVIDEVQNAWRPRGPGQKVPPDVQALETHRHRGLDFYIITQGPNLVDTNVRALVGRHIHLRDVGVLGRYWYEWPECADNCRTAWKNAPLKKRYKLPKQAFSLYKSASLHVKPLRSFPWMLVVAIAALAGTAGLGYYSFTAVSKQVERAKSPLFPSATPGQSATGTSAGAPPEPPSRDYDQTLFYPQLPNVPESAPAYAHLRKVINMPRFAGGFCTETWCKCYSEQGTHLVMSDSDCRRLIASPPYDPWRVQARDVPPAPDQAQPEPAAPTVIQPS